MSLGSAGLGSGSAEALTFSSTCTFPQRLIVQVLRDPLLDLHSPHDPIAMGIFAATHGFCCYFCFFAANLRFLLLLVLFAVTFFVVATLGNSAYVSVTDDVKAKKREFIKLTGLHERAFWNFPLHKCPTRTINLF